MADMFMRMKARALFGHNLQRSMTKLHWDMLQHLAQVDLVIRVLRHTSIEKCLTDKMHECFRAENTDTEKQRACNINNELLAAETDRIPKEECCPWSRLAEVLLLPPPSLPVSVAARPTFT